MTWFEKLVGFREENPSQVQQQLKVDGEYLISLVNDRKFRVGELAIPSLAELRAQVAPLLSNCREACETIRVEELVADVGSLHRQSENAGALFQVASQFNLLEMVSPEVTPEAGVGCYEFDRTQGPVCAIACGAGTIYRNYFVSVNGELGQSADNQVNCLADFAERVGNVNSQFWKIQNGYVITDDLGLGQLNKRLDSLSMEELESLGGCLRIGVQKNTEVTEVVSAAEKRHVTQVYGSALPVSYNDIPESDWEKFARLILNASYEATLSAALTNREETGNNRVFLTLLGGGVFGNRLEWILDAIRRAIVLFKDSGLSVSIVSFRRSNRSVADLANDFQ